MHKRYLSSLLCAVLTAVALSVSAAETSNTAPAKPAAVQVAVAEVGKVNLNTADAPTLQRELSGIGETKAKAIVAYREAHGAFTSVDEVLEVKGIGESILAKNRDKLSIN
ncbi:helix-hairpin-helix domain-containing protein [Pseudomonas sp. CC6-YY-74]|uniref:ComEA family DNA-binding protein n=1 Tax=Pseudomonas sp. CC6-YY-74 TaxID=1930532 RepID=UPI0009A2427C|nr:helix-hairpin-helix domain-containing protein [Pseudomonas sp. CC6-YY-74]